MNYFSKKVPEKGPESPIYGGGNSTARGWNHLFILKEVLAMESRRFSGFT
jgi:hypothetical protein